MVGQPRSVLTVLGSGVAATLNQRVLFGVPFDALTMDAVVDICDRSLANGNRMLIGVVNAAKIVNMRRDDMLRAALLECDLILADGQAVVWASSLLGRPLPERIAGIDLFEKLLEYADKHGHSIYLLGAKSEVLTGLRARIVDRFPGLRIAGSHDGYFIDSESPTIAADVRRSGADMLFLGMTSPKKEIFLGTYADSIGVRILHGVGGSFDIFAGITKRAPVRWQRLGLEWLYRLLQEPGRMSRRYLITNSAFIWLTAREFVAREHRSKTPMSRATHQHTSQTVAGADDRG
jgi:N-acetylglucosaminyldiphosphoundecaprenol N-acetyl-beta-D-mannosaminyltransferase